MRDLTRPTQDNNDKLVIFYFRYITYMKVKEESIKKFNYVYVTTNLINGKQYVGDHSTNKLNDGYLGSGRPYFQNAKNKYGKENFERKILEFFDTKQEAFNAQEKWINEHNTLIPNGYNISPKGGHGVPGCMSLETKDKIRKAHLGKKKKRIKMEKKILSEEHKKKISEIQKGRKLSEETKKKMAQPRTEEHKQNISAGSIGKPKGRRGPMSEEHKQKISSSRKGNKLSNETKAKIKANWKGKLKK